MQPFTVVTGAAAPLMLANIDTDLIIRIDRLTEGEPSRLGDYALEALRRPGGHEDPDFVLNRTPYRGAPILLAGPNFGCGSSREPAVTALLAMGVRCVVAESFGDIFYANCFQNGLLPVRLDQADVLALAAEAERTPHPFTVDLQECIVRTPSGADYGFEVDGQRRTMLMEGLDDIGLTLKATDAIEAWQARDRLLRPWIWTAPNLEGAQA
jgi:3-isopropylmalate/(R)-2-methylmalate dehydratase small subunit